MMFEIWVIPVLLSIVIENRKNSIHRTKKYIKKKFIWTYFTNYWRFPFVVMVKIYHCHSFTTSWYSGRFKLLNENYIILWYSLLYSSSCENMKTKITIMIKTKIYTTPDTYSDWMDRTSIIHTLVEVPMTIRCKQTKKVLEVIMYWLSVKIDR